ncbi:MAG: hypothetical protein KGJ11_06090 [Candidatus Omnitrophica bacterium]|nr:hypothetical protein [Candidatus Omnitrophota bacterium]
MSHKGSQKSMQNTKVTNQEMSSKSHPAGAEEVMKVFERFQEAYAVTEQYLSMVSPKTHQSNSSQSFLIIENK